MSALEVTTVALVKTILSNAPATEDALIGSLIQRVSRQFEGYLGRDFEKVERDEDHDVEYSTRAVFLRETPVDLGETFEVRFDRDRAFTGSAQDSSSYHIKPGTGRLSFDDGVPVTGHGVLRVKYTGGFAVDSATLQSAYPDIEYAGRQQVAYLWQRRDDPGSTVATSGAASRSYTSAAKLLPAAKEVLDLYRRVA